MCVVLTLNIMFTNFFHRFCFAFNALGVWYSFKYIGNTTFESIIPGLLGYIVGKLTYLTVWGQVCIL